MCWENRSVQRAYLFTVLTSLFFCLQESSALEPSCVVKVDEYGFFIYWKSDGKVNRPRFPYALSALSLSLNN